MLKNSNAFSSFSSNDLDKSQHFYSDILGLDVSKNKMGILELKFNGSNHAIIYPKPDHVATGFTVLNFPVKNLEETVDELIANGVKFEQYDFGHSKTNDKGIMDGAGQGPKIAWFKDPAGNILSVMEQDD
ncbi:MAG: VOC family protein [Daejeonella sp.]